MTLSDRLHDELLPLFPLIEWDRVSAIQLTVSMVLG